MAFKILIDLTCAQPADERNKASNENGKGDTRRA